MSFFKAAKSLVKFAARAVLATAFVGATLAAGTAGLFVGALAVAAIAGAISAISVSTPFLIAITIGFILAHRSNVNEAKKEENKKNQQNNAPPPSEAARAAALQSKSLTNDWQAAQQARSQAEDARQRAAQAQATAQKEQAFNPDPYSSGGQAPYSSTNYYSPEYRY